MSSDLTLEQNNNSVGILIFDAKGNIVKSNLSQMVLNSSCKGNTISQDTEKEIIKLFMKLAEETSTFLENQKDDQAIDKIQFSFGDLEGVIFTDSKALWHVIVKRNDAVENISIVENANLGSTIKRNTSEVNTGSMINRKSHEI